MDQPWVWAAIGTSYAIVTGLIIWIVRLVTKLNAAGDAASNANIAVQAAKMEVNQLSEQLNKFKVEVAKDYVSKGAMEHLEQSIIGAINHLTSRFDQFLGSSR